MSSYITWIPGCLTPESLSKGGLVAQHKFPKQTEPTFKDLSALGSKNNRIKSSQIMEPGK